MDVECTSGCEKGTMKRGQAGFLMLAVFAALSAAGAVEAPVWQEDFPDPTTWRAPDGTWYASSTTLKILKSGDFLHWSDTGTRIFAQDELKRIHGEWKHIWAPDAFRLGDEFLMFVTLYNSADDSAIAVYSSKSPEGPFADGRILTRSRDTGIRDTIDPEAVRDDRDGTLWLFFGSIGGIHRARLAPDGKSLAPGAKYEHVAGCKADWKNDPARSKVFEGAYLHRRNGWWYLFASRGCYGDHTYAVVVGRAKTLDGPFLDREGRKMAEGFATTVLSSKKGDRFFGPGHNGEIASIGGRDLLPHHCHVQGDNPKARPLFVTELTWDSDGWPKVATLKISNLQYPTAKFNIQFAPPSLDTGYWILDNCTFAHSNFQLQTLKFENVYLQVAGGAGVML